MVELPASEIEEAKKMELSRAEKNVVRYLGGYFFGKLLQMHPKSTRSEDALLCSTCGVHGKKFTFESLPRDYDTFLALKRYQDKFSTLYTLSPSLEEMVTLAIKVTSLVFKKYLFLNRIVASTALSVKENLPQTGTPAFCSEKYLDRFLELVVRTILTHKVEVLNKTLRKENQTKMAQKRETGEEKNEISEKRRKLTHN